MLLTINTYISKVFNFIPMPNISISPITTFIPNVSTLIKNFNTCMENPFAIVIKTSTLFAFSFKFILLFQVFF